MKRTPAGIVYSPSDLITFFESEYASWMDRFYSEFPNAVTPDEEDETEAIVRRLGFAHEHVYRDSLAKSGRKLTDLTEDSLRFDRTMQAMVAGDEVIYQGSLELSPFAGYPDFLERVPGASALGDWHYELCDTKLARHSKPYFVVQLCCYAEMLEAAQGVLPANIHVVLGTGERQSFRTADFYYFYKELKAAFLLAQARFDPDHPPEFSRLTSMGRWSTHTTRILEERDDVSLVAHVRSSQVKRLREAGITTLAGLAAAKDSDAVPRMSKATFQRLRRQASLQIASHGLPKPRFELLPAELITGPVNLTSLPSASPGDIYFDIEGFPLVEGGLEYLFGVVYRDGCEIKFKDWWAHDRAQERALTCDFLHWVHDRWETDPAMHIYHYAPYEVSALRRLTGRHGVCEEELDDLLRNEVFVDLYGIVRNSVIVGEPSYSLKNIEKLYSDHRGAEVKTAGDSIVYYQRWLDLEDGADHHTSATLRMIRDYNEEDCRSTYNLADWLRALQRQADLVPPGAAAVEGSGPKEDVLRRAQLAENMLASIPEVRSADPERWRVHELLAWLLEFHRREDRPMWWAYFDRLDMTEDELFEDPECLAGLVRTTRAAFKPPRAHCSIYEYRFDPSQEIKLRDRQTFAVSGDAARKCTIHSIDFESGLVELKVKGAAPPHRVSLVPYEYIPSEVIARSIERVALNWRDRGELPAAIADFLFRRAPRINGQIEGAVVRPTADLTRACIDVARRLAGTTLCIQGPPGGGKTYTAAHMIADLVKSGARVGVTSNSHKAICLLLAESAKLLGGTGVASLKAGGTQDDNAGLPDSVTLVESADVFGNAPVRLVGGTAWLFSREDAASKLDYLFVDEAGQVCVANLVGMAPSTRNIILIGDQMQLSQPTQGCHPGESGMSTLDYYLNGAATIPPERGIFLENTYRLHPALCKFISDAVYDGRLQSHPSTVERVIQLRHSRQRYVRLDAGLVFVPVIHDGNTYESLEECAVIRDVVAELTRHNLRTNDRRSRRLTSDDFVVVAPYNLQVRRLREALPDVRVGTVDKFQGQEAPVVIYSMCASTGHASPRGIEFLFSKNRLNVAISRAQTLAIIVGNPALARTNCGSLEQMKLVNVFCRALHYSQQTAAAAAAKATVHA